MSKEAGRVLILGCILAMLSVVLGAFGAHGLKSRVAPDQILIFETGVRYQFYHGLAILSVGMIMLHHPRAYFSRIVWLFGLGILFFSGSLYILATREITGLNGNFVGPLTPIGGLLFILGWLALIMRIRSLLPKQTKN